MPGCCPDFLLQLVIELILDLLLWCLTLFVNVVTIINRSAISILSAQWRRLSDSQRDNNKDCKCPPCFECVYFLDVNEQSNAI